MHQTSIDKKELYDYADEFINLANNLAQKNSSGIVGIALRFAAARYSAFEASLFSKDMKKEKEFIKEQFLKDYESMLEENLEVYIKYLESKS